MSGERTSVPHPDSPGRAPKNMLSWINCGLFGLRSSPWPAAACLTARAERETRCLSIATKDRVLDLECLSAMVWGVRVSQGPRVEFAPQERDTWVVSFRHLLRIKVTAARTLCTDRRMKAVRRAQNMEAKTDPSDHARGDGDSAARQPRPVAWPDVRCARGQRIESLLDAPLAAGGRPARAQ